MALAQEPVALQFKLAKDATFKYKLQVAMTFDNADLKYEADVTQKVLEVGEDGKLVLSSTQSGAKLMHAGQQVPYPGAPPTFHTYSPKGITLEIGGEGVDAEDYRFAALTSLVFPEKPVAIGETWQADLKADKDKGSLDAKASYQALGREPLLGKETLKVSFEIKEVGPDDPATSKGVMWIEIATGMPVKVQSAMTNAPLAGQKVNATWELTLVPA